MSGIVGARLGAERVRANRDAPPAAEVEPFRRARLLDPGARVVVAQEDRRQPAPRPGHERRRDRQQDPRAVAGAPVGRHGAAMPHPPQPLERRVEHVARRAAADVGDEADAAGIAFA